MSSALSLALLQQIIDAAIEQSVEIETASSAQVRRFGREEIGRKAFGVDHGAAPISRLGSARHPLTREKAQWILDAVKALLDDRCNEASAACGRRMQSAVYLRRVCRRVGLAGDVPCIEDLLLDDRLLSATSVEDLGFDDLARWDSSRAWRGADAPSARPRSMEVLRCLESAVRAADSVEHQICLAEMAAALAMHHQPGTAGHKLAYRSACRTAEAAHIFELSERRFHNDAHVASALFARMHLLWALVAPHVESSTNYLTYMLNNTPLPSDVLGPVLETLDEIDVINRLRVRLEPGSQRARTDTASANSVRARMLLAAGGAARLREADRAHAAAIEHSRHAFHASCLVFPVLRAMVRGNPRDAARACESAMTECRLHGRAAEGAFAGLCLLLTRTYDGEIRELARNAVASPQISYLYSHIHDAKAVRSILRKRSDRSQA